MGDIDIDHTLLTVRDQLELRAADGDHRYDWLLKQVRQRINEQARQACLDAEGETD